MVSSEPARAIILYETFLAGCYAKAEEVDDSGGSFVGFVGELFCGWVKARQAAHADPGETAARLVAWMDDDPYGFASDLDREASAVHEKAGRAAFVREARSRFDAAAMAAPAAGKGARWRTPEVQRRVGGRRLRTLYAAQKNAAAYLALTERKGLTAEDCRALAKMQMACRKFEDALDWVERGLSLDRKTPHDSSAGHDLAGLKRGLLSRLRRRPLQVAVGRFLCPLDILLTTPLCQAGSEVIRSLN